MKRTRNAEMRTKHSRDDEGEAKRCVMEEDTEFNARTFKFILMNRNSFERTV